ncbi:MAG: MltA domain-containing protein [Bdellovibrionales bacterium]
MPSWTGRTKDSAQEKQDTLSLRHTSYNNLQDWGSDNLSEAAPALLNACQALTKQPASAYLGVAGRAGDWREPCAILSQMHPRDDLAMRAFFENWFRPWAVHGNEGDEGLFTGYYEASLNGSWSREGRYQTPLYMRPRDLISVDLSAFRKEWKGKRIAGKVQENQLIPYDDRVAIMNGTLAGRARPLMWVDSPIDAFFLEVQGSGRVKMRDGKTIRIGYDGANGQAYASLGRILLDMGELARPVTMQSIRQWLETHSDRAQKIMGQNASYVFFRTLNESGPIGAQGVPLTSRRSLAVDPAYIPLGMPMWLETKNAEQESEVQTTPPLLSKGRLVVAQDTGGAIKGVVRGDFFWGYGKEAEAQAGVMQTRGKYYILLPRTVVPNEQQ